MAGKSRISILGYLSHSAWIPLFITLVLRLPSVNKPLLGNFATKNVVHAMIARNWAEGNSGMFYPALDCLKNGKRSLHMLEFSFSAYITAIVWMLFGGSLDAWGRLTSVAFSAGAVLLLYHYVRTDHGLRPAVAAALMLALSPISIIYGQAFMLDASILFFTMAAFACWRNWCRQSKVWWLLLAVFMLVPLWLTKIYLLVLVLPLLAICWESAEQFPQRLNKIKIAVPALIVAAVPTLLWSLHAIRVSQPGSPFADHIFASLQGNVERYRPPDPLLWNPDFYRRIIDDLVTVILTPLGFGVFLCGFLHAAWRRYRWWLLAMIILVLALPRKFYEMNYYFVATLPPLCIVVGLGWQRICKGLRLSGQAQVLCLLLLLLFALRYSFKAAYAIPNEDRAVVEAGRMVQRLTASNEPVATMHGTGIALLYYCNRVGLALWSKDPQLAEKLRDCIEQGARILVVAGPDAADPPQVLDTYPIVVERPGYKIYRLTP